jgi:hypothetical protein
MPHTVPATASMNAMIVAKDASSPESTTPSLLVSLLDPEQVAVSEQPACGGRVEVALGTVEEPETTAEGPAAEVGAAKTSTMARLATTGASARTIR